MRARRLSTTSSVAALFGALGALGALAACGGGGSASGPDPGLESISLTSVGPSTAVPGTELVLGGSSFIDDAWGSSTLHLVGGAGGMSVDKQLPATFVDFQTMTVKIDAATIAALGGEVDFTGTAAVEVVAVSDGQTYASAPINVALSFRNQLPPGATRVVGDLIFVNDAIEVDGSGFLLGGDEGTTFARVAGCFQLDTSSTCDPITQLDIAAQPKTALDRTIATFPFSPALVGIRPGVFNGTVTMVNKQTGAAEQTAPALTAAFQVQLSEVTSVDPPAASLGQFVFVHGGGFVGGDASSLTVIELSGTFTKTGGSPTQVLMQVIPEYVAGQLVRYAINTDDELGHALDLRKDTGSFSGTATPILTYGTDSVRGSPAQIAFDLAPVRQVVYLNYHVEYVEELRDYGLRAVDKQVRDRILAVVNDAYKGVNMDFRTTPPTDFALFSNVDLIGIDPNNMGLFGYDNSPGKDVGNVRLYDSLGGVNAVTQQDGYPGFGGVFVRSLMGFSQHPGSFAQSVPGADPAFDQTFDPFRSDQGGHPILAADVGQLGAAISDGSACPAADRQAQIQCAVYVMGNLIGGTLAHEIGHSLGLANPYGDGFHDPGDAPNRLMDAGGDRPFLERAVLQGQGPGVFCDDEYTYLRQILPSSDPPNSVQRPGCM